MVERFIPFSDCCEQLGIHDPVTLTRACERYGVPITSLSSKKRGLMPHDFDELLKRARGEQVPVLQGEAA